MPYKNPEDKIRNRIAYAKSGRARAMAKRWLKANREHANILKRAAWIRIKSSPERLHKYRVARVAFTRKWRQQAIARYGNCCACCGESEFQFLGFDHINGGGNMERKLRGTSKMLQELRVGVIRKDIRVLCHNCNLSYGFYGYCPHKAVVCT